MQKYLLYIVLFTYTSMMFKPVMPYLTDVVAHTLFYESHISTVHYEDGKLHVHKQVLKETENDQKSDKPLQLKKDSPQNDHYKSDVAFFIYALINSCTYSIFPPGAFPAQPIDILIPPPRFLA